MHTPALAGLVGRRAAAQRFGERERLLTEAAELRDLVTLGRGDPDLPTPQHIVEAAKRALDDGETHYTHWRGRADLREAIAATYRARGVDAHPDRVIVTAGSQEAMFVTFQALLDEGDEVLLGDPHYGAYSASIRLTGGTPVFVPTARTGFVLDAEEVERRISPRTKALVVVTPDNPTGAVIPVPALEALAQVARRRNLVVVADDIYEHFVFEGPPHAYIAGLPGMMERTVVINGFSKTYAMTGWRIGYLIAPPAFTEPMEMVRYILSICAPAVSQAAALAAVTGSQECIAEMRRIYSERRRVLLDGFAALGLPCPQSVGSLFVFPSIASAGLGAYDFCRRLLREAGVQIFPSTAYGHVDGYVRASFLQPVEVLREAIRRMTGPVREWQHARERGSAPA